MIKPDLQLMTLCVCALSLLFPSGVLSRRDRAFTASVDSLSTRLDGLEASFAAFRDLQGSGAGSGPVPVSRADALEISRVAVPWRSYHACGSWLIESERGRIYPLGTMTPYGRLVEIGPAVARTDNGTILVLGVEDDRNNRVRNTREDSI